jgi:hypothetical protein
VAGVAAVEAEDEFIEVGLQVFAAQAVVDAEGSALEVGEDAMGPRQDDVGGHRADDVRLVDDAASAGIAGPAVGPGGGAGFDIGFDEGVQAFGRSILDRVELCAQPPNGLVLLRPAGRLLLRR